MARRFTYFIVYLLFLISLTYGEHTTARPCRRTSRRTTARPTRRTTSRPTSRTDHEYYISEQPYECCPTKQEYSKEDWNKLISSKVKLSDFGELQKKVIKRLKEYGMDPSDPFYSNINCKDRAGLKDSMLKLYTGSKFFKDFNIQTKEVIEGKRSMQQYRYPTEYALINEAYIQRAVTKDKPLFRGATTSFNGKKGETFSFNHFASTSEDKDTGLSFTKPGGTLFEIYGGRGIFMDEISQYPGEGEYLIHPFEEFEVRNIECDEIKSRETIKRVVLCRKVRSKKRSIKCPY